MAEFTDKAGRKWEIDLVVDDLTRVREETGYELGKLVSNSDSLATFLYGDPERFMRVLYSLCREQIEAAGVSERDFARGMNRKALEGAVEAVWKAVTDFTQPPKTAAMMQARLRGLMEAADEAASESVLHAADEAVGRLRTSNGTAGNSPESSASTRDLIPSAN